MWAIDETRAEILLGSRLVFGVTLAKGEYFAPFLLVPISRFDSLFSLGHGYSTIAPMTFAQ